MLLLLYLLCKMQVDFSESRVFINPSYLGNRRKFQRNPEQLCSELANSFMVCLHFKIIFIDDFNKKITNRTNPPKEETTLIQNSLIILHHWAGLIHRIFNPTEDLIKKHIFSILRADFSTVPSAQGNTPLLSQMESLFQPGASQMFWTTVATTPDHWPCQLEPMEL